MGAGQTVGGAPRRMTGGPVEGHTSPGEGTKNPPVEIMDSQ